ncbi:flavin-containing amine oxidoreductase-domain containing protein [Suillus subluteus]|nr:flavin-containing amine oxidoreductase-domain containing protein [Suillus subluteus]
MRFPLPKKDAQGNYKIGMMTRLGELINYSKLNKGLSKPPLSSQLIDYHFTSKRQGHFLYFNNQRHQVSQTSRPPDFRAREMGVDSQYIAAGVENIVQDVIRPFAKGLIKDLEQNDHSGWRNIMKHNAYSLRLFMSLKYTPSASLQIPRTHLSTNVIHWCETFDDSTGAYDRGLTEAVFQALALASVESQTLGGVEWKCFEGGSQVLTDYMAAYLTANGTKPVIQFNKKVTSILQSGDIAMNVSVRGECSPRTYSHVISTIPLPGLRMIELGRAGLNVMQKNALRKVQYAPSIKVGMRFRSAWWTELFDIIGGKSSTDLPIRTIMYPSHGAESSTPSTVLIASYCLTDDAERLRALINTGKIEYEEQLKELVLRNLAEVHNVDYSFLLDQYVDMHAWDWSDDPFVMGGFAFFGPGDFQDLYTSLTVPNANKRLHFAGEAISVRHSWVVGALDSAWRAVYEYLLTSGQHEKIQRFFDLWGQNVEWAGQSKHGKHDPADPNTMLRVHMGYTYAGELTGEVKF